MPGLEHISELRQDTKSSGGTFDDGSTWDEIIRLLEEEALRRPAISER